MKIYNNSIQMNGAKILLTQNPFNLIHNIRQNNNGVIIITPWTKYNEIFNYKKDNFLANMFNERFEELPSSIINIDVINDAIENIHQKNNINFLQLNERGNKIIKDHINVAEEFIDKYNLTHLIKYINKFARMETKIIIVGYDVAAIDIISDCFDNIDIAIIITSLSKIDFHLKYIESIIIHYKNTELLEILDIDVFKKWLEIKSQIVINEDDINDYFNNVINNKTIIIEKCLQTL